MSSTAASEFVMRCWGRTLVITAVLSLDLPVTEFVELQRLPDEERRVRLQLPASCVPRMTAMKTGSRQADHVVVEVRCQGSATSIAVNTVEAQLPLRSRQHVAPSYAADR